MTAVMNVKYKLVKVFWSFLLCLAVFGLGLHILFATNGTNNASDLYFKAPPVENHRKPIVVETYNEHVVRTRLIQEKVNLIKHISSRNLADKLYDSEVLGETFFSNFTNVQILYHAPVKWHRVDKHVSNFNRIFNNTFVLYKDEKEYVNVAFYPRRGFYINITSELLRSHFLEIQNLGINAIVWNWEPTISHELAAMIFQTLSDLKMKCSIQIDAYEQRTVKTLRENLAYFLNNFQNYPSWNRYYVIKRKKHLPLFYIKEAYKLTDLKHILVGKDSIRNTPMDAIIIGHYLLDDAQDKFIIRRTGIDGFYSYSAVNGGHFSATWKNWAACRTFAKQYGLIFVPTIAPGYQDKIKAKNGKLAKLRHRSNGEYYGVGWRTTRTIGSEFVLVNSYNNFIEGKS